MCGLSTWVNLLNSSMISMPNVSSVTPLEALGRLEAWATGIVHKQLGQLLIRRLTVDDIGEVASATEIHGTGKKIAAGGQFGPNLSHSILCRGRCKTCDDVAMDLPGV